MDEQVLRNHAYIISQSVLAYARIEGMKAENEKALQNGISPPYGEVQFEDAMSEYAIDHNSVMGMFLY